MPDTIPLTAGIRWSYVQAVHEDSDSLAAEAMHRVGPLVSWKLGGDEGDRLSNISAFTIAQWWLRHPYRTGEVTNQAVPYFILGLSVSGEFLEFN
ncbi:MAG: hypothetical protein AAFV53_08080 [Myxococcota bacterium]